MKSPTMSIIYKTSIDVVNNIELQQEVLLAFNYILKAFGRDRLFIEIIKNML